MNSVSQQIFIVSSRGILVNRESTSKLPIIKLLFWLTISSAKQKESFTENSLAVTEASLGSDLLIKVELIQQQPLKLYLNW